MKRYSDKARLRELSIRALLAAAYVAMMLAGYAAGIALLMWRCASYAPIDEANRRIDLAIRSGALGVEQLRPPRTGFEDHLIEQAVTRFRPFNFGSSFWESGEWIPLGVLLWIIIFLSLGFACHIPAWVAPRVIRAGTRGSESAAARVAWRDALRRSAVTIIAPGALATMFLTGLAVVTLCDVASFRSRVLETDRYYGQGFMLDAEVATMLCVAPVVSFAGVWLAARRRIRRNPEMTRLWCARCGYSLRAHTADPSGAACCPECGRAVLPPGAPRAGRRLMPALAAIAALALLIATNYWSYKLEDLWIAQRSFTIGRSDGIYVKVGGVTRMLYPEGTIWFRVDPINPGNGATLTFKDVVLRVVVELPEPTNSPEDHRTVRKLFTVKVNDPQPGPLIFVPIAKLSTGEHVRLTADWNDDNLVLISLVPACATSIQAVDPAIAPSFDAVDQPSKP